MNKPKLYKVVSTLAASTLLLSACGVLIAVVKDKYQKVETNKFSAAVKMMLKRLKTDH